MIVPDTARVLDSLTTEEDGWKISIIGYSELKPSEILPAFRGGTLGHANGEFLAALEGPEQVALVNSRFGTQCYYYAARAGKLFHGPTVLGVLADSGLAPEWDWAALGDMLNLEHTLGSRTLHPAVRRVAPGETISLDRGREGGDIRRSRFDWESEAEGQNLPALPEVALDLFNRSVVELASPNPTVLMTAGFDSRVILSSLLAQGIKPILAVAGWDYSTDVIVAQQIGKDFGLEVRVAELSANDLVESGADIATWSSGLMPVNHTSPYFYCQRWGLGRDDVGFMGMNGEYARTFYVDRGMATRALDKVVPSKALRYYWKKKFSLQTPNRMTLRPEELQRMRPELAEALGPSSYPDRVERCIAACRGEFLSGLDRFYLEQRVASFMGNLLRLCALNMRWRCPFLDSGWVNVIRRLPRSWKGGSNWHRYAVAKNCPKLMDYQEQHFADRWSARAPAMYWRRKYTKTYISYLDPNEAIAKGPLHDFAFEHAEDLSDLVEPNLVRAILEEHRSGVYRGRALYYFLTLMFWAQARREVLG